MIAYHLGDGEIVPIGGGTRDAAQVSYDDSNTHIQADEVQTAIENLYNYFYNTYPGWFTDRRVTV